MVLQLEKEKASRKCITVRSNWTAAVPSAAEKHIISVSVGNTSMSWALHKGIDRDFSPLLFWRTPPMSPDEWKEEPANVLSRHIPQQGLQWIFGDAQNPTRTAAATMAAAREAPAISVYLVSSNPEHEKGIHHAFSEVCHRMFRLENTDFCTKAQGCYPTLGVDRACTLFAARDCNLEPALIFDGGTAWTYTGLDAEGNIMGGGISPGIGARFRSLSDYCGRLPVIEREEIDKVFEHAKTHSAPLPIFASETKTAILTSVFQEVAGQARNIVKHFLAQIRADEEKAVKRANQSKISAGTSPAANGSTSASGTVPVASMAAAPASAAAPTTAPATTATTPANDSGSGTIATATPAETTAATSTQPVATPTITAPAVANAPVHAAVSSTPVVDMETDDNKSTRKKPTIIVTGGDYKLFNQLLKSEGPIVVPSEPGVSLPHEDFILMEYPRLLHYGIGRLILNKFQSAAIPSPDDELRTKLLGLRVAKKFSTADQDGNTGSIYRGVIAELRRGNNFDEDLYRVLYDDGDSEYLDPWTVFDCLQLYVQVGEMPSVDPKIFTEALKTAKKEAAQKKAAEVLARSTKVQKHVADKKAKQDKQHASSKGGIKRKPEGTDAASTAAKKAKVPYSSQKVEGTVYVDQRVAKVFPIETNGNYVDTLYFGTVKVFSKETNLWHIVYDDDDEEDYDERDLKTALLLYAGHVQEDPQKKPASMGSAQASQAKVA